MSIFGGLTVSRVRVSARTVAAALALSLISSTPAHAVGVLDQSITGTLGWNSGVYEDVLIGQTFTAGITGVVDRVTIDISREGNAGDLVVSIYEVTDGIPTGEPLAVGVIDDLTVTEEILTVPVDFDDPAPVLAGSRYAIVASAPDAWPVEPDFDSVTYKWGCENNPVADEHGLVWFNDQWSTEAVDYRFATYVSDPPVIIDSDEQLANTGIEIHSAAGVGLGIVLAGLVLGRLRRKLSL